jgi:hypothetical protein
MAPFADNTLTTMGELRRFEKPAVWMHLRKYRAHPVVVRAHESYRPLARLLRGIAFYSAQLVSIGDSSLPEKRKLKELARYVQVVVGEAAVERAADDDTLAITKADVLRISAEIAGKETFLEGIAAAEPIADAALRYGLTQLDQLDVDIAEATGTIGREVEAEFAQLNANVADVSRVEQQLLRGFALLHRHRLGEAQALDELRGALPRAKEMLPAGRPPALKELDALEGQLTAQLERVKAVTEQLAPDLAEYEGCQQELDALRAHNVERARLARMSLILWARSHRNLGKGIAVPPAIDIGGMLKSTAMSAAKAAVPF